MRVKTFKNETVYIEYRGYINNGYKIKLRNCVWYAQFVCDDFNNFKKFAWTLFSHDLDGICSFNCCIKSQFFKTKPVAKKSFSRFAKINGFKNVNILKDKQI